MLSPLCATRMGTWWCTLLPPEGTVCDISAEQLSLLLGVAFVNMHGVSPLGTPLCHPYRVAPQSWRHPSADPPVSLLLTALFPWGVGGVEGGTHFIF